MGEIRSNGIEVVNSNTLKHHVDVSKSLQKYFDSEELIVKYPIEIDELNEDVLSVPLLTNLCTLAWVTDSTLRINILDETLAESLEDIKAGYQKTLDLANIDLTLNGEIIVEDTNQYDTNESIEKNKTVQLFTGGVDSTSTYLRHRDKNPNLITVKRYSDSKERWERIIDNVNNFSNYFGTEVHVIETNFRKNFLSKRLTREYRRELGRSWWAALRCYLGYMGICAPLTVAKDYTTFYQASSYTQSRKIITANPDIINELSWSHTECKLDAYDMTRQDKINQIVDVSNEIDYSFYLYSCGKGSKGKNCSKCLSCYRNILGLLTAGATPESFGMYTDENVLDRIRHEIESDELELSELEVEFWKNIQRDLDHTFAGPSDFYQWFESVQLDAVELEKSLGYKIWKTLPYPADGFALQIRDSIKNAAQR